MYLRFQGKKPNLGTPSKLGKFQLAYEFRNSDRLADHDHRELSGLLKWFNMHLASPGELDEAENFRAISWFKSAAREPLNRIWLMKAILDEYGYVVELIKTDDPGVIIYEDGWQIVAKPKRG